MKILLAGGGSGGHFYPLIAVARSIKDIASREKIFNVELEFISDDPYDLQILREEEIKFVKVPAGKIRRYFSIKNLFDPIKTIWGILKVVWKVYLDFPDVVFAKGGYASFPTIVAARFLGIPLIIHESDIVPGKVSLWASRFATRIAISFPESVKHFPSERVALTGNPIRHEVIGGNIEEARDFFGLEPGVPVLLILGGSQGASPLNDIILDILPKLLDSFEVVHQTGKDNFRGVKLRSQLVLEKSAFTRRYHPYAFLDEGALRAISKAATIVIARAGSGTIFELAAWALPAILVPLSGAAQDHQRENAYAYAREGAAVVLEEENLAQHILLSEIDKLFKNPQLREKMSKAAQSFSKVDAADKIAGEIIKLALGHS